MGVDVSSFCMYGVEWEDAWIIPADYYDVKIDTDYELRESFEDWDGPVIVVSKELCNKYNLMVQWDRYSMDYQMVGIQFLNLSVEETIENLKEVNNKWLGFLKEINIDPSKYEPKLLVDYYYW